MADRQNARVPGHGLQNEGKPFMDGGEGEWSRTYRAVGVGLCSCGATSPELDTDGARKRWHLEHKAAVREQLEIRRA